MHGHLTEEELAQVAAIARCRTLGRPLDLEEEFAQKLRQFDWAYRESDSAGVARAGAHQEEELIAEIDDSDLSDELKMKFLNLFTTTYAQQAAVLAEYSWLNQMRYATKDPESGRVGLLYKGVTDEQYTKFHAVAEKLNELGKQIAAAGCSDRLLMTDDCINFTLLRDKATQMFKDHKDCYYFGVALPQASQDLLDSIVRTMKPQLVALVEAGAAKSFFGSFGCDSNNPDGVWHISIQTNNDYKQTFGFFLNPKPTRERRNWVPKTRTEDAGKDFVERTQLRNQRHDDVQEYVERQPTTARVNTEQATGRSIPAAPVAPARKKAPLALSNRPMSVDEKPRVKPTKTAPTKRKTFGKFIGLGELKA